MVFSNYNQSVCTEYSEAVNARYTFQPLWVSGSNGNAVLHINITPLKDDNDVHSQYLSDWQLIEIVRRI